jgi:hypothetical protein
MHMSLAGTNLPNEQPEKSGASELYVVTLRDTAENQAFLYQAHGPNARAKSKQACHEPGKTLPPIQWAQRFFLSSP